MKRPKRLHYFMMEYKHQWDSMLFHALVAIGEADPNIIYWGGTFSHCELDAFFHHKFLHDYGWDDEWDDDYDVDAAYLRDLPLVSVNPEDCTSLQGIVSPDGKFYACEWGGHTELAKQILAYLGQSIHCFSAEDSVLALGYISIRANAIGANYNHKPTLETIAMLNRIGACGSAEKYLHKSIEWYKKDTT